MAPKWQSKRSALTGIGAATLLLSFQVFAASPGPCESALLGDVPGFDYSISTALRGGDAMVDGVHVPAHCRVEGELDHRIGAGGKPYGIRFALILPDDWNGRFLFQGGGGLNGVLREPLGRLVAGTLPAVSRSFAVVSTDSGHQSDQPFDPSFLADQEALLNFLYKANEKVTRLAKAMIAGYYGVSDFRSYFVGCSTGGREGMTMSQRYPDYFDGIISGAPAMRTNFSELGDLWAAVNLRARNPDGSSGDPLLSDTERTLVATAVMEACDDLDGLSDGMIFDVEGCHFDPRPLICEGEKTGSCLTVAQADGITKAFQGAMDSRGFPIYSPFPYDSGIAAPPGRGAPGLLSAEAGPLSRSKLAHVVDWDEEAVEAADFPLAFGNTSEFEYLNTFSGHNGKLIFYHGVSDPWFSALDTVRYYRNLQRTNGGSESVNGWSRLFLIPGMGHCSGGQTLDQFDLLSALVDWVERGEAPDRIVATGKAFPHRSRPLCPYPKYARYTGAVDKDDAASFECTESTNAKQ